MSNIDQLTYRKYEEYSTSYIIYLDKLNEFIIKLSSQENSDIDLTIEQWIQQNCYHILTGHLIDDFNSKIAHNLILAQQQHDISYVKYISQKLNINIDEKTWTYIPNKIKIKIKSNVIKEGFKVSPKLSVFLGSPPDKIYKYRSDIVKLIHKYIYDNQLQNRYDRKTITPDDQLQTILSPFLPNEREYTYLNLVSHIDQIIPI